MKTAGDSEYFSSMSRPLDRMIRIANNLNGKKNSKLFSIPMLLSNHPVMNNHPKMSLILIKKIIQLQKKLLQNL